MAKLNKTKVKKAIELTGGNITKMAERIGVTRWALYKYLNDSKNNEIIILLGQEREKLKDETLDVVKSAIIDEKDKKVAMWLLPRIDKSFSERQEIVSATVSANVITYEKLAEVLEEVDRERELKAINKK